MLVATLTLGAWGCEDDEGATPLPDAARADGGGDGGAGDTARADGGDTAAGDTAAGDTAAGDTAAGDTAGDGGDAAPTLTEQQKRGQYLVDVLYGCGDCHTPRDMMGAPIAAKYLAGVSCLLDVSPAMGAGCISSRNLTNHETGLKNVTNDAAIKDAFQKGVRPDGKFLHTFMPYYEYANVSTPDANAIVAYLRVVPGVDNRPTASEPPFDMPPTAAAAAVNPATVPMPGPTATDMASAMRGRDMAMVACIGCHTKEKMMPIPPAELPLDSTKFFAGARDFPAAAFGLPSPPFPMVIYTQNLTQDATGIMGWTADDVVKVLKMGLDKMGKKVCPPMPAGPMGNFGKLTDTDARDIANYIVSLPAVANALPNQCMAP